MAHPRRASPGERGARCRRRGAGRQDRPWPQSRTSGVAWVARPSRPRAGSPFRGTAEASRPSRRHANRTENGWMTDTIDRGAANQAGAIVNKNAYDEAQDFLPLKGIDHVEFWVGNARQAAHYFRALWGFTPVAYAGLETGIRDRTSYVLKQNDITLVVTGALGPDSEIAEHVHRHGDGVHDIAFSVDDVKAAWRETTTRGAESYLEYAEAGTD